LGIIKQSFLLSFRCPHSTFSAETGHMLSFWNDYQLNLKDLALSANAIPE